MVSLASPLLLLLGLSCLSASWAAAAAGIYGGMFSGMNSGAPGAAAAAGFPPAAAAAAAGGMLGACVTPSVLLPRSREDAATCLSEHSVGELTNGEWLDLKWGTIEVMCRRSSQSIVFYLKNFPRFSWNPFKSVASAVRRFAGSVDMKTASVPLRATCECDNTTFPPFYAEVFRKEQYLVGAKLQSAPRRLYEFFGRQTPCEPPQVWDSAALSGLASSSLYSSSTAKPFEFQEIRHCLFKLDLPYEPRVFASRNEVIVSLPGASDPVAALTGGAAAGAAAATGQQGHLTYTLPPACHMREVSQELRVWVRGSSAAGAAAGGAAAAAAAAASGFLVRAEPVPAPEMFEVYMEVSPSSGAGQMDDALYYYRMDTVGDFQLAVERGQI